MDVPSHRPSPSRREVLQGAAAAVSLSLVAGGLPGCETRRETPRITRGVINVGPADNYPAGTVSMAYADTNGIALANDSGPVLAINLRCTHRGCLTKWDPTKNQFVCPCHGSRFSLLGMVLKGPAMQPLRGTLATRNPDGTLSVDLDKLFRM